MKISHTYDFLCHGQECVVWIIENRTLLIVTNAKQNRLSAQSDIRKLGRPYLAVAKDKDKPVRVWFSEDSPHFSLSTIIRVLQRNGPTRL